MNDENDHSYYRCILLNETVKAYLLRLITSGKEVWVPKSLCELRSHAVTDTYTVEVEAWFAKKEMED